MDHRIPSGTHTRVVMMVMAIVLMVSAGEQGARGGVCSGVLAAGLLRLQGGQEDPHPPGAQGPHQPLGGHQLLEKMASHCQVLMNGQASSSFARVCRACGALCDRRVCVKWLGARVLQTPIGTDLPFIGLAFLFRVSCSPPHQRIRIRSLVATTARPIASCQALRPAGSAHANVHCALQAIARAVGPGGRFGYCGCLHAAHPSCRPLVQRAGFAHGPPAGIVALHPHI